MINKYKQPNFLINCYIGIGTIYGLGRSYYYLNQLEDRTYTNKREFIYHPPTISTKLMYTLLNTTISSFIWPILSLSDLSVYEKSKMNIYSELPPYPFFDLRWRK